MLIAKTARARAFGNALLSEVRFKRVSVSGHWNCVQWIARTLDGKEAHTEVTYLSICLYGDSVVVGSTKFSQDAHIRLQALKNDGTSYIGDDVYHTGRPLKHKGLFLCAVRLAFTHPITGLQLNLSVPTPVKLLKRWAFEANRIMMREKKHQGEL